MGANQICVNIGISGKQEEDELTYIHAPDPNRYPQVGDDPSSLPCDINHIRQEFASRTLRPPEDYKPAPFKKDSFFELFKDTVYYQGEWSNGEPNGQGEVIFSDQSYFRGYFKDMQARGPQCLFVLSDGAYYFGGVSHNKRDGQGSFNDKGYVYEGEWLNNLPHGKAKQVFPNGDTFEGKFVQGKRAGSGTYNWASGPYLRYEGIFQDNMLGKKGVLALRNGTVVEGQFNCNQNFDIAPCLINAKTYQLTNCLVNNGAIETFVYDGQRYSRKAQGSKSVLKRRKLIFCEESASEQTIQSIVKSIEEGYQKVRKHSQALSKIRELLPQYRCEWWSQEEEQGGLLIAEICGRKIKVTPN